MRVLEIRVSVVCECKVEAAVGEVGVCCAAVAAGGEGAVEAGSGRR
jgi:hypothetical protein